MERNDLLSEESCPTQCHLANTVLSTQRASDYRMSIGTGRPVCEFYCNWLYSQLRLGARTRRRRLGAVFAWLSE
jgi:hypothetical protein